MPTKSRKTYRVIEPEVQNNKNVVSVTLDFAGNLIDCCTLSDFLGVGTRP